MVVCGYDAESTSDGEGANGKGTFDEAMVGLNMIFSPRSTSGKDPLQNREPREDGTAPTRGRPLPARVRISPAASREAPEIANAG